MAQWVKNPTAAARVAAEVWVRSSAQQSGLTDGVLLQLWLRFSPGNFHMPHTHTHTHTHTRSKKVGYLLKHHFFYLFSGSNSTSVEFL